MNANWKPDEVEALSASPNQGAGGASAESVEERDLAQRNDPPAPTEEASLTPDAAALAREARLMRFASLACRGTLLVVVIVWLLAVAFPPAAPPSPSHQHKLRSCAEPSGCARCSQDNALYGRAIAYDEEGHPIFRRIEPQRNLREPQEVIARGNGPSCR